MSRPPKASLENRWLCASTNPCTSPWELVPLKGSPVTLIWESGAGRAVGVHQSVPAAELGPGPSISASTASSRGRTARGRGGAPTHSPGGAGGGGGGAGGGPPRPGRGGKAGSVITHVLAQGLSWH